MKKLLLSAVSAVSLIATAPAFAETQQQSAPTKVEVERTSSQRDMPSVTRKDMKEGWENTKDAVSEAAEDLSDATQEAYGDMKQAMSDDQAEGQTVVKFDPRNTANGMIGKNVYNAKGEAVGKVHDIILDRAGEATMVVVADGEIFGLGKKVAFDYGVVAQRNPNGDVIAPLTEETIDNAVEFSYNRNDAGDSVRVIPSDGYSVNDLLKAQLVNEKNESVAEVDNIIFSNGEATQLVISFNTVLGMAGDKAALPYNAATVVKDGNDYDFKLSANRAAQFETFKQSVN